MYACRNDTNKCRPIKITGTISFGQHEEGEIDLFTGEHVGVKTNGERQRAREVADDLNRQHQRRQHQHRPKKLLDVAGAVARKPVA